MKAVSTQGLVAKNLMPYMGVQFDQQVTFSTGEGPRHFRIFTYQAYNAMGLVGSECNGIAIGDDDKRQIVTDEIAKQGSGYFGASQAQFDEAERICAMDWETFMAFINADPRKRMTLEDKKPKAFKFKKPCMADVQFMTAAQKHTVLKDWVNFVNCGFRIEHFTKALYNHLIQHCSFIAHYNAGGFYDTYFQDARATIRFLSQFDRKHGCASVEYGDNRWIGSGDYSDLNNSMVDIIAPLLPAIYKRLSVRNVEAAKADLEAARERLQRAEGQVA
jgi:hypothetical protein